jgi:hypothetical protein
MPYTDAERESLASSMEQSAKRLSSLDVKEATRSELAALGFSALEPSLTRMCKSVAVLSGAPLHDLPYPVLVKASNAFGQIEPFLNELRNFNIVTISQQSGNPLQVQQGLLGRYDNVENAFWEYLAPVIAFALAWKAEAAPSSTSLQTRELLDEAQRTLAAAHDDKKELETIVGAAREAAGKVGVARHAALFATEASANETVAGRWLIATGIAAGITLLAVVGNVYYVATTHLDLSGAAALQVSLAKILSFSVLISATVWCGKIYRAARHNYIVNRHRQNALSSFETFVQASTDDQTRNAVLLHAAQCIFAPQASGFASGEGEGAGSPNVIELIRTIAPQAR